VTQRLNTATGGVRFVSCSITWIGLQKPHQLP